MAGGPRAAASGEYLVVPYAMAMEKKACSLQWRRRYRSATGTYDRIIEAWNIPTLI